MFIRPVTRPVVGHAGARAYGDRIRRTLKSAFGPDVLAWYGDSVDDLWKRQQAGQITLWQDVSGTVPVTALGQQVGKITDPLGRGNDLTKGGTGDLAVLTSTNGVAHLYFDLDTYYDASIHPTQVPLNRLSLGYAVAARVDLAGDYSGFGCYIDQPTGVGSQSFSVNPEMWWYPGDTGIGIAGGGWGPEHSWPGNRFDDPLQVPADGSLIGLSSVGDFESSLRCVMHLLDGRVIDTASAVPGPINFTTPSLYLYGSYCEVFILPWITQKLLTASDVAAINTHTRRLAARAGI